MMENQKELFSITSKLKIARSFVVRIFLIAFLFIILVSCQVVDVPKSGINSLTLEPSQMSNLTKPTSSPFPISTITPTSRKIETPTFISSSTPQKTMVNKPYRLFEILVPGAYVILGDGALSLSAGTITPLSADDIPTGRLSQDRKRTISINRGLKEPNDFYYQVTDFVTGDQLDIPVLSDCKAIYPDLSPDEKMIITACSNHEIIVQAFPDGKEVSRIRLDDPDHPGEYSINHPLWSFDGKLISYIEYNHGMNPESRDKVFVLNRECLDHPLSCQETKKLVAELQPSGINLIDWASQNRLIILEQFRHRFIIYDVNKNQIDQVITLPSSFDVRNFAVSPDGNQIYFGQLTVDEKGSAVYRVSLEDGKVNQLYYGEGLMEIVVYYLIEK